MGTPNPKRDVRIGTACTRAERRKMRRIARKHGYKGSAILRYRSLEDVLAEDE